MVMYKNVSIVLANETNYAAEWKERETVCDNASIFTRPPTQVTRDVATAPGIVTMEYGLEVPPSSITFYYMQNPSDWAFRWELKIILKSPDHEVEAEARGTKIGKAPSIGLRDNAVHFPNDVVTFTWIRL